MTSIQDLATKRIDLYLFDPRLIQEAPGWNVRDSSSEQDAEEDRQLRESIRANGVLEPLTVFMDGDAPTLTNGHRRLTQVRALIAEGEEIKTVPVRVEPKKSNEADHVLSMITRNSGKPLRPIELAQVVRRLVNFGWSNKDVAAKTGFSESYVFALLELLSVDPTIIQLVKDGKVSASLARDVSRKSGKKAPAILQAAVEQAEAVGRPTVARKDVIRRMSTPEALVVALRALELIACEGNVIAIDALAEIQREN